MKVLIIKMTSMGDVIHLFPALNDAVQVHPEIEFHWAVDPSFAEIPAWHSHVKKIIPVPLRKWRKKPVSSFRKEFFHTLKQLREESYDLIIDAQGLLKSALVARVAKGLRVGLNIKTVRERSATLFYKKRYHVEQHQHAITRLRELFAKALNYPIPTTTPNSGLTFQKEMIAEDPYAVFLHGTTWVNKHWPEAHWAELIKKTTENGVIVYLPWGSLKEKTRAERLALNQSLVRVLPKMGLTDLAQTIKNAKAVVAVDTGLSHLSAALNVPTISIYGPTDPGLTGSMGESQQHLQSQLACSPCLHRKCHYKGVSQYKPACMSQTNAEIIWQHLKPLLQNTL